MKIGNKIVTVFIFILTLAPSINAQEKNNHVVTDTLVVSGVCGMCKERIENAATIKGVKKVEWTPESQQLIVVFRDDKVTLEEIAQSVAEAGHDNELIISTDAQYEKVHDCCKYREIDPH